MEDFAMTRSLTNEVVSIQTPLTPKAPNRNTLRWWAVIERGPAWLFVHLEKPSPVYRSLADQLFSQDALADSVWTLLQNSRTSRVVLELDSIGLLEDELIGELLKLGEKVQGEGGLFRICGLSKTNLTKLHSSLEAKNMPHFCSRSEAVGSRNPGLPR